MLWLLLACAGPVAKEADEDLPRLQVGIWPEHPAAGQDDLSCYANEGLDPEGAYELIWTVDGQPFEDAVTSELIGDTVPASVTVGGQVWSCQIGRVEAEVTVHAPFLGWDAASQRLSEVGEVLILPQELVAGGSAALGLSAVAADTDGDGRDEIVVAAWGYTDESGGDEGRVWRVRPDDLSDGERLDWRATALRGGPGSRAGESMAAGDFDGDGLDDLLISGGGICEVWLLLGRGLDNSPERSLETADYTFYGGGSVSNCEMRVASGDLDGDGLDDVVLSVIDSLESPGWVYGLRGMRLDEVGPGRHDLAQVADFSIAGESGDRLGAALSVVPDLDGDGRDELAFYAGASEEVSVFTSTGPLRDISAGRILVASRSLWITGHGGDEPTLLGIDDIDGDDLGELVIGSSSSSGQGSVAVYLGQQLAGGGAFTADDAKMMTSDIQALAERGPPLAAGDIDGDGLGDLLVGAPTYSELGDEMGLIYLLRATGIYGGGRGFTGGATLFFGEEDLARAGTDVATGDFNGDGLDDLLMTSQWFGNGNQGSTTGYTWVVTTPAQAPGSR